MTDRPNSGGQPKASTEHVSLKKPGDDCATQTLARNNKWTVVLPQHHKGPVFWSDCREGPMEGGIPDCCERRSLDPV